jgi:hypothetical protein
MNCDHDLAIAVGEGASQIITKAAAVDGAEGLWPASIAREGRDGVAGLGTGQQPTQKLWRKGREIDRNEEIQVRV